MIKGIQISSSATKKIAKKVGIPDSLLVPEVIVVNEGYKGLGERPMLHSTSSPSGYTISIPNWMLKKVKGTTLILGSRVRDNIQHELGHYLEHVETGSNTGERENTPYRMALKEVDADLRSKTKHLPLRLHYVVRTLVDSFGIPEESAFQIVSRAARHLGVSKRTLSYAKNLKG